MNISIEACKADTYVGCPAPATVPPKCESGWEIGNGTMTCAVEPTPDNLATTGSDFDTTGALVLAWSAILIGSVGMVAARRMMRHGRELRKAAKR